MSAVYYSELIDDLHGKELAFIQPGRNQRDEEWHKFLDEMFWLRGVCEMYDERKESTYSYDEIKFLNEWVHHNYRKTPLERFMWDTTKHLKEGQGVRLWCNF